MRRLKGLAVLYFAVCYLFAAEPLVAQAPYVYFLEISPPSELQTSLPVVVTATMRVVFPPGTESAWSYGWDSPTLILEKSDGSSTISASPDFGDFIDCPEFPGANYCQQFEFSFYFDAPYTAGEYLPTVTIPYTNWLGFPFTANLNPAALQAAGITATFTLVGPPPPPPPPGCSLPPVSGGSPGTGISDTTPPQMVGGACVDPATVDVRTGSQTVKFSLRVQDDLSGFAYGWLNLWAPNSSQYLYAYFGEWNRVSGNEYDGTYEVSLTIPVGATPGTWTAWLNLNDAVGNWNGVQPMSLADPNNPAAFEVISNEDTTAPAIQSVTFSPTSINVSAGPQTVTMDMRITDAGTGFSPWNSYSYVDSPGTATTRWGTWAQFDSRISGNDQDGVYRYYISVPRYSPGGAWSLRTAQLRDLANNAAYLDRQYNPTGLPATSFTVISSPADTAPPVLTGITASPAFVNTALGSQNITLTFTVTDNLSGVTDPNGCYAYLVSPSGQQSQGSYGVRQSGTALSGVYSAVITLPRYAETGTWRFNSFNCGDNALNNLSLWGSTLTALYPNVRVDVIQPSGTNDGTVGTGGGAINDQGSVVQLTFPPGSVNADTQVAIDVFDQPPAVPAPVGFTVGSVFVSVELIPSAAAPFPLPGVTLVLPLQSQLSAGTTLVLYKVNPATGRLVPMPKVGGGIVDGIVDATGLKATFTGISSFSTVVGLIPPGRLGDLNGDNQVSCEDIALIRNSWNKRQGQPGFDDRADFNRDRVINLFDLAGVARYLPKRTRCQ